MVTRAPSPGHAARLEVPRDRRAGTPRGWPRLAEAVGYLGEWRRAGTSPNDKLVGRRSRIDVVIDGPGLAYVSSAADA